MSLAKSRAWCQSLAKQTAGNFYYSFLTLPKEQRIDMCVLYAFMRISDDIGDDATLPLETRRARLAQWHEDLRLAFDGRRFHHPLYPALMEMVARRNVPSRHLYEVLEGIESDLAPQRFATFDDLNRYCYHVAGAVGLCCIHIWGFHDPQAIPLAIDCGTAFQLTNILRDLKEDAAMGRVYLPQEDLVRFGYTESDLGASTYDDRFRSLMKFEVARAREFYDRSDDLLLLVDAPGRPVLSAMRRIYGGLLNKIEYCQYDVFSRRIILSRWMKVWIAFQSFLCRGR